MTKLIDLKLGADGDMAFERGDLVLTDDLAQAVAVRLRFIRREWFLDSRAGLPYLETILGRGRNLGHVRSAYRAGALETPGIAAVRSVELSLTRATRELSVAIEMQAETGEVLTVAAGTVF